MRRLSFIAAVALMAVSCVSTPPAEPTTTSAPASTTSTAAPTTVTTAEPTGPYLDLTTVGCDDDPGAFTIFCETVELISEHYVDNVATDELVDAATRGLREFAVADVDRSPLLCAVPSEDWTEMCEAFDELDPDPQDGVEALLDGITAFALDPNSVYLDPRALAIIQETQSGTVEGIGALVTTEDLTADDPEASICPVASDTCRITIVSTLTGSPAEAAGVRAGDEIVSVDGDPVEGRTLDSVTAQVRGQAGTDVTLGLLRGETELSVTITRAAIVIPVVETATVDGTAYLRLNLFTNNSDEQLRESLQALLLADPHTLVLDLRDNPGGSLDSAVEVASEFIDDGLVVRTQAPDTEIPYPVREGGLAVDPELRLLVLVNRGSASASEVVAGAIQEAGRGLVIGEATFGKNTVQRRFSLANGGAIKLTIARWVTPGGVDFGQSGIRPDITAAIDPQLRPAELVERLDSIVG